MTVDPACNIEIKAQLESIDRAREIASRIATSRLADEHQVDTYFRCNQGRLKLREINSEHAQLISYDRPDDSDAKASRYFVVPISDGELLKQALASTLGVWAVIDKRREIFLHENVRIHLDRVRDLGTFLEFEAVLSSVDEAAQGYRIVQQLLASFGIEKGDLLSGSYSDMLR